MPIPAQPAPSLSKIKSDIANKADKIGVSEPAYYFVIAYAGQSNAVGYGEGLPLPNTFDAPSPRIKQLARRSLTKPVSAGGIACDYNSVIELDHCAHHVQNMSIFSHPNAVVSNNNPVYGTVGAALHVAKKLLPLIPSNAGILVVPCARGGSGFTNGTDQIYSVATGAPEISTKWGVTGGINAGGMTALYMDLRDRVRAALSLNPKNVLLSIVWCQGEADLANSAGHKTAFEAQVNQFITDINSTHAAQCLSLDAAQVPWICGDAPYYWKTLNQVGYTDVYETTYGASTLQQVKFVRFMTDETGANVRTNDPLEDPDILAAGYYGSASRTSANWTSSTRNSHFSGWSNRGIVAERISSAIVKYAGRSGVLGTDRIVSSNTVVTEITFASNTLSINKIDTLDANIKSTSIALPFGKTTAAYVPSIKAIGYNGRRGTGHMQNQGWVGPEYQSNTSTIIAGSGTMPSNTTAGAVTHPDGQGGFTWRFTRSAASTASYSITASGVESDLINLFTNGGYIEWRSKITTSFTANQFVQAFYSIVQKTSLSAGLQAGLLGTDNGKVAVMGHFIQHQVISSINSLSLMAHQNGGNVTLMSIPFDNNYHTFRLDFTAGSNIVNTSIDGTVGSSRASFYTAANYTNYGSINFTNITAGITSGFDLDYLVGNIYKDNGTITPAEADQDVYVALQENTRNHTVVLPNFSVTAGTRLTIDAANTGTITVSGASTDVLIKKLGSTVALPSSEVITRAAGAARQQIVYVQVGSDGKTWVRTT